LPISFKIKKVLTEEEFSDILEKCTTNSKDYTEDIKKLYSKCNELTKEITPADEVYMLLRVDDYHCEVSNTDIKLDISNSKESAIQECCKTKNAIVIQDVSRSFIFNQDIDNFANLNIKSLMLVPLINSQSQEVIGIIWAGILKGNINQYTQEDLNYMKRLAKLASRYLMIAKKSSKENSIDDLEFQLNDCIKSKEEIQLRLKREEDYFATIIHDIRSPMNAVMGFLELLKLQESDNQKVKYIESALESADSMISLINDALDLAKISSGKMTIEKKVFSPIKKFASIARLFFGAAIKKQISFFAFYDPKTPSQIVSDYNRIKQIINNLLSNSLKFTDKNGKIILIMEYIPEKDGLYISVEDTGIGIAKDKQDKIFSPYIQENSDITKKYGGTGLGLSISYQLAMLLGGKLELESEKGKGSKFYFTIPCNTPISTPPTIEKDKYSGLSIAVISLYEISNEYIEFLGRYLDYLGIEYSYFKEINSLNDIIDYNIVIVREKSINLIYDKLQKYLDREKSVIIVKDGSLNEYQNLNGKVATVSAPILPQDLDEAILQLLTGKVKTSTQTTSKIDNKLLIDKKVLVIDDNPINLKFMKEILKRLGADILLARSGDEALEYIKDRGRVDFIFVDKNMPVMDGYETIREIRKIEKSKSWEKIVIIALTGDSDDETIKQMAEAGADDILTKPIHINQLIKKMNYLTLKDGASSKLQTILDI